MRIEDQRTAAEAVAAIGVGARRVVITTPVLDTLIRKPRGFSEGAPRLKGAVRVDGGGINFATAIALLVVASDHDDVAVPGDGAKIVELDGQPLWVGNPIGRETYGQKAYTFLPLDSRKGCLIELAIGEILRRVLDFLQYERVTRCGRGQNPE